MPRFGSNSVKSVFCRIRDILRRKIPLATTDEEAHHGRMSKSFGLGKYNIIGFVSIVDVARAIDFYRDTLGLRLVMEDPPFALVLDANGIRLRLGRAKKLAPALEKFWGWGILLANAKSQH